MKAIEKLQNYFKIKKFKRLCLCPAYFAGCEMYRLLNYDILQELAKKVEHGNITLSSDLLFGKKVISTEEQFLYILNKYIVFIRNNCFINTNEFIGIIEETLKSKYSKILYNHLEFTKGDNFKVYYKEFKRMFLDSLFTNFKKFTQIDNIDSSFLYLKDLSLDNDNDADELFNIFISIVNYKQSNLFNFFIDTEHNNQKGTNVFYAVQWEHLINEYNLYIKQEKK